MTKAEKRLWYDYLRKISLTVHRQRSIGPYIVDFFIPSLNLIIELDGGYHFTKDQIIKDRKRDSHLSTLGYLVVRITNDQVLGNLEHTIHYLEDVFKSCNRL